ncbi:MAG: hypothetical protein DRP42_08010 [Tenericutes bacterium]|nr:MAG: hypothetical protein DRP42_08010 [Mycoplasmatota bacterium]
MTTQARSKEYIGLALPAIRTAGGYFASKDRYETAWGDLLLAIFIPIRSRPMRRSIGSAAYTVLFEMQDAATAGLLQQAIITTAETQCPHLNILDVVILPDKDGKKLKVKVTWCLEAELLQIESFVEITFTDVHRFLGAAV